MLKQCLYLGVENKNIYFLEKNIKRMIKTTHNTTVEYIGKIQFKKEIPTKSIYLNNKYGSFKPEDNILFLILEGEKKSLNYMLNNAKAIMEEYYISTRILDNNMFNYELYFPQFIKAIENNPNLSTFENEYVYIEK